MVCTVAMAVIAVAAVSTLTGCAGSITGSSTAMQGPQLQKLSITGALSYRARIALPPKARAIVELREGSTDDGPVIAEYHMELKGKQVPLPFELVVSRTSLMPGKTYSVRGAVFVDGRPTWVSNPAAIDPAAGSIDVGTLSMLPAPRGAFSSVLSCGDERVTVGFSQTALLLTVGGKTFEMRRIEAASGARYEAVEDPTTTLWNEGDRQTITVRGRTLPECGTGGPAGAVYRGRGNEPFWSLEIAGGTTTFKTPGGIPISALTPRAETITGGRRFVATAGDQGLTATILDRPCVDDMSGMPYPDTVIVLAGGREYRGCGGDPEELLQGAEWVVKDVNGTGPIDNSRLTLAFGSGGRVSGHASCNTYTGQYAVTGEGTTVSKMATTRKLCAPSLMAQEDRFLDVLRNVSRFEISPDGALILHTGDGRTITARR